MKLNRAAGVRNVVWQIVPHFTWQRLAFVPSSAAAPTTTLGSNLLKSGQGWNLQEEPCQNKKKTLVRWDRRIHLDILWVWDCLNPRRRLDYRKAGTRDKLGAIMQNLFRSPNLWHKSVPQIQQWIRMFFLLLSVRTIIEFSFILWSGAFIYFPSLDKEFAREQKEAAALWLLSRCSLGGKGAADRVITMCFTPDWDRASFLGITFCRCLDSESTEMAAWHNFVPCMNALRQPTLICHLNLPQFSVLGTSK